MDTPPLTVRQLINKLLEVEREHGSDVGIVLDSGVAYHTICGVWYCGTPTCSVVLVPEDQ